MEKILLSINQIEDKNQREVVIPDGYTKIGDGVFRYCTSLENVVIPDSVTKIGWRAFSGCTSLESVSVPRLAKWEDGTFENCPKLKIIRR